MNFVLGTDWPSVDIGKNADAVAQLPLPEADIRAILGETAGHLLGLAQEGRGTDRPVQADAGAVPHRGHGHAGGGGR